MNKFDLSYLAASNRYKISTSPNDSMQVNSLRGIAYQRSLGDRELIATNSHLQKKALRVIDERRLISRAAEDE